MLTPPSMPGLKEDLPANVMYCLSDFSPRISVVLGDHERSVFPVAASPIDESAFSDDETSAVLGSISVVLDLGWAGFVIVDAAVAGH